jgi:hypothetical protein
VIVNRGKRQLPGHSPGRLGEDLVVDARKIRVGGGPDGFQMGCNTTSARKKVVPAASSAPPIPCEPAALRRSAPPFASFLPPPRHPPGARPPGTARSSSSYSCPVLLLILYCVDPLSVSLDWSQFPARIVIPCKLLLIILHQTSCDPAGQEASD